MSTATLSQTSTSATHGRGPGMLTGAARGPLPRLTAERLVALADDAGLTGRGGAGFPTHRKLASALTHRPVVVGNAMEGEYLSRKDAALLSCSPDLVLDGLELLRQAFRARRTILATGPDVDSTKARTLGRARIEVLDLDGGFVAGQESALVNAINGRLGVPSDPSVPVFRRGVDGRPTLACNAETLAHLAMIARYGASWFRDRGAPGDPGTFLVTLSASSRDLMERPGVVEASRGSALRSLLAAGGTDLDLAGGVLVGGYHGCWLPMSAIDVRMDRESLSRYAASVGAGVVHVLDRRHCPVRTTADIAGYLARESAGQCGPCVNGLPAMVATLGLLADPRRARDEGDRLVSEIERLAGLVTGRGACAHPDGTARMVGSLVRSFPSHVRAHLRGECDAEHH